MDSNGDRFTLRFRLIEMKNVYQLGINCLHQLKHIHMKTGEENQASWFRLAVIHVSLYLFLFIIVVLFFSFFLFHHQHCSNSTWIDEFLWEKIVDRKKNKINLKKKKKRIGSIERKLKRIVKWILYWILYFYTSEFRTPFGKWRLRFAGEIETKISRYVKGESSESNQIQGIWIENRLIVETGFT